MSDKILITGLILILIIAGVYFLDRYSHKEKQKVISFKPLSSSELAEMLRNKDFKLIDVHIPEQRHIPGTDYFIPFNEIQKIVSVLPNKNEKIVLYCRSGNMSRAAAKRLIEEGYTNIYDLTKGINEWIREGRKTIPLGSVKTL
jgi:rhodanese-related sulfurtransferase